MSTPPMSPPLTRAQPQTAPWRWWLHLTLLGGYPLLLAWLGRGAHNNAVPALGSDVPALLRVSAFTLGCFALLFALACCSSRVSREELWLAWRPRRWVVPLGLAYSLALRLALAVLLLTLPQAVVLLGLVEQEQLRSWMHSLRPDASILVDLQALRSNGWYRLLALTLVSFVVAGLREELQRVGVIAALRALAPRAFGTRWGPHAAVLVAALLFGLGHFPQGWGVVLLTFLLGLGLGEIMRRHRSIWPAVIAHGAFDALSFGLLPLVSEQLGS